MPFLSQGEQTEHLILRWILGYPTLGEIISEVALFAENGVYESLQPRHRRGVDR